MTEPWKQEGKKVVVKSAAEWVSEAAGAAPFACPRCHCPRSRVINSYETLNGRNRRRVCANCGQGLVRTTELPVPEGYIAVTIPVDENCET